MNLYSQTCILQLTANNYSINSNKKCLIKVTFARQNSHDSESQSIHHWGQFWCSWYRPCPVSPRLAVQYQTTKYWFKLTILPDKKEKSIRIKRIIRVGQHTLNTTMTIVTLCVWQKGEHSKWDCYEYLGAAGRGMTPSSQYSRWCVTWEWTLNAWSIQTEWRSGVIQHTFPWS